jgi:hypothetical protein
MPGSVASGTHCILFYCVFFSSLAINDKLIQAKPYYLKVSKSPTKNHFVKKKNYSSMGR